MRRVHVVSRYLWVIFSLGVSGVERFGAKGVRHLFSVDPYVVVGTVEAVADRVRFATTTDIHVLVVVGGFMTSHGRAATDGARTDARLCCNLLLRYSRPTQCQRTASHL